MHYAALADYRGIGTMPPILDCSGLSEFLAEGANFVQGLLLRIYDFDMGAFADPLCCLQRFPWHVYGFVPLDFRGLGPAHEAYLHAT